MKGYTRRKWLKTTSVSTIAALLGSVVSSCQGHGSSGSLTILLVSGWQDVNIGDIAHTPGLIQILRTFLPTAEIILWKKSRSEKVEELIKRHYPEVQVLHGNVREDNTEDHHELIKVFEKSDILIHGSGPGVIGRKNIEDWMHYTDKPFGLFGVTIQDVDANLRSLLAKASFIYTRESKSLDVLHDAALTGDQISFAPDATFLFNLKDDLAADSFLTKNGLVEGQYICAIPRLRYTPYHLIRKTNWTPEKIHMVEQTNEKWKEKDHAKLREALIAWVRKTGNKVLLCPEMTYQVDIMDELLLDPLPEDVKTYVVKHGYWMPDEAASIYAKAFAVLSFECHSPILALAAGTPAFYLRQPEDTIKGQMYYDLGLDDWAFEIEETEGELIAERLLSIWNNAGMAEKKVETVQTRIDEIYRLSISEILNCIH